MLSDSNPFRGASKTKSSNKQANKKVMQKRQAGFDCVRPRGAKNANDCIYWMPGVCVPLSVITLRRSYECQVCFDNFKLADGIQCHAPEQHFLCKDCFSGWVESESKTDALDLLAKRGGRVFCAVCP